MSGWRELFGDWAWARGEGRFPIAAYSEFMPPPRIGQKPYGHWEIHTPFEENDAFGFHVTAAEMAREIVPGTQLVAQQLLDGLMTMATGRGARRIGRRHLEQNPYWPGELAERAPYLTHEHYVLLSPLALSKTQDDKGRVRWTLFGASQTGPAKAFWQSFYAAPDIERPESESSNEIRRLLSAVYGGASFDDLKAVGFRILPTGTLKDFPSCEDGTLPAWTRQFLLRDDEPLDGVRFLLTFRPFALLPDYIRISYLAGGLNLLPFPGSLVFWGSPHYRRLEATLPYAGQILLQQTVARHASPKGMRVPQSGWLHHGSHDAREAEFGQSKTSYRRTHRWQRMNREDDSTSFACDDQLHKVLFSASPEDVGLYGKPMARNAQIWSNDFAAVLDGPRASGDAIRAAAVAVHEGRSFGYRFFFPPMQAGSRDVFWHRPLVAYRDGEQTKTIDTALHGYFTAKDPRDGSATEIPLWPRIEAGSQSAEMIVSDEMPGEGESLQAEPQRHTGPDRPRVWSYAERTKRAESEFGEHLDIAAAKIPDVDAALTFARTATREFELRYWKTIASLAEGAYLNKNSADTAKDPVTQARIPWPDRDLDRLGDHLLDYYRGLAETAGVAVRVGAFPFRWQTDFDYPWMDGWYHNQTGKMRERNIVAIIPGKNRNEAIVMGDHYDTAYMEDVYGYRSGKNDGARMAASGADDNHSATAALMLAAESFIALSREGKLERDIWIVHLTGEEFPSDCLGARDLAQKLVEGTCRLEISPGESVDLSGVAVKGVYVLDMIAHNNDRRKDVFQIAPGSDRLSLWLAYQAHVAARLWEAGAAKWNATEERKKLGRARRSPHGGAIPLMARHLAPKGEIRFQDDPRSTLFNTDGQIFSDAGIPVVLFMENYDINREGYHDTQDTMANIDLDYGSALAAITIEAVARAASEPLPEGA